MVGAGPEPDKQKAGENTLETSLCYESKGITMSGGVYGGDEVGALVFDPGHYSLRVGYAGEDCPKGEIPAVVGVSAEDAPEAAKMEVDGAPAPQAKKKYHVDTTALAYAKKGMEVVPYLKDGMIDDWGLFEELLDYSYEKVIKSESELHPVLFSEASWNQKARREKLAELMFEKYGVPAFFLAKAVSTASPRNCASVCPTTSCGSVTSSALKASTARVFFKSKTSGSSKRR